MSDSNTVLRLKAPKLLRVVIAASLLTAAAGYVVRADRTRAPAKLPLNDFRMAPEPHWKFTCPAGWSCPDLEHPHTWKPPETYLQKQYPTEGTKETRI